MKPFKLQKNNIKRITILIIAIIYNCTFSYSRNNDHDNSSGIELENEDTKYFTYYYTGDLFGNESNEGTFSDVKTFGEDVARKIAEIDKLYIFFPVNGDEYRPRIMKQAIYGSFTKIKSHYKTQINKKRIDRQTAIDMMNDIVQKTYVCAYQSTADLEATLFHTKSLEETIAVFNRVKIIKQ